MQRLRRLPAALQAFWLVFWCGLHLPEALPVVVDDIGIESTRRMLKRFKVVWDLGAFGKAVAMEGGKAAAARNAYVEGAQRVAVVGGEFWRDGRLIKSWGTLERGR